MAAGTRRPGRPKGPQSTPEERRAQLLDAAESAIREHGPGVSMEQIAERADVSKATIYDNFDGKAGLTEALVDRYGRRLLTSYAQGLGGRLTAEGVVRAGIAVFVRHIESNPEVYRFIVRNTVDDALLREIASPVAALVASVLAERGADRSRADALAYATLGAVLTAAEWWSQDGEPPRREFESLLADYVWGGLLAGGVRTGDDPVDVSAVAEAIAQV